MGTHRVAVLPGDGIGPEVVDAAIKVLEGVRKRVPDLRLDIVKAEAGFHCIERYGTNLPEETLEVLKGTKACLKGPMTTPEEPGSPVSAAVKIRKHFDLYANVRPNRTLPNVASLKPNIDFVIVRENTEGLYVGIEMEPVPGIGVAFRVITKHASERIARFAFKLAMERRKKLAYVHKGNILKVTDGIFKGAVSSVAKAFAQVQVEELHIDAATMQLIKRPETFDVIVTTNMFGDILSDEAAQLVGGLGVAAGANIGEDYAMFEPVHGSAPKYTGQNKVNPVATILAGKMMLDHLGEKKAGSMIERAVSQVLEEGKQVTYDLGGKSSTSDMAEAIVQKIA